MSFKKILFLSFVAVLTVSWVIMGGIIPKASAAEELRIGVPLTYGPQNQPWQRGAARLLQRIEELGGKPVTLRGVPSGDSERSVMRRLMQMDIKSLAVGIYSKRSESIAIVKEAKQKGIKTTGWITFAVDSPSVQEDAFGVALTLCRKMIEDAGGEGGVLYTAESPGFYPPFDMMCTFLEGFMKYQPRMKLFPYVDGGVSTADEIALSRKNFGAVFRANPQKGTFKVIMSFWWPDTIGAIQAMREQGRDKEGILVYNQYVSHTFYSEMARPDTPVVGTTDTDWRWIGEKLGEILVDQAKGKEIPENQIFWCPVPFHPKAKAQELLEWTAKTDEWTHKKLREYGG